MWWLLGWGFSATRNMETGISIAKWNSYNTARYTWPVWKSHWRNTIIFWAKGVRSIFRWLKLRLNLRKKRFASRIFQRMVRIHLGPSFHFLLLSHSIRLFLCVSRNRSLPPSLVVFILLHFFRSATYIKTTASRMQTVCFLVFAYVTFLQIKIINSKCLVESFGVHCTHCFPEKFWKKNGWLRIRI